MTAFLRWIDYFHIGYKWVSNVAGYEIKRKVGKVVVYQDSGVYHHAVSYYDIGHISTDFRYDAYDFMARDKLGVKQKKMSYSLPFEISFKKKSSRETWPGTRPKK